MNRRRLDVELVRRRLFSSRAAAQQAILAGEVEVDGFVATKAATQVAEQASVRLVTAPPPYVSRGGLKLEAALDAFAVAVTGRHGVDLGASTGGFTDCLLQRGAGSVAAIDVGYGQLHWKLRSDPRVTVHERLNVRHMDVDGLGGPWDVVVADLSFISLALVAEPVSRCGHSDSDWVLLIKPQFEAGRDAVGKGGIVRDPAVRAETIEAVVASLEGVGLGARGIVDSPIQGSKGNHEFLIWLRRGTSTLRREDLATLSGLHDA